MRGVQRVPGPEGRILHVTRTRVPVKQYSNLLYYCLDSRVNYTLDFRQTSTSLMMVKSHTPPCLHLALAQQW